MSATTRVVTPITNAATKTYSYSTIDLLDVDIATLIDQIDVYLTPASTGIQRLLVETTDFTYAALPTQEITLEGDTATNLALGDLLTIRRSTKDDARYTNFTDLGFLRSEDVNTNGDQLLFLIQENSTDVQDALIKTDDQLKWQGQNLPATNCANASDSTGWATLGQVTALISGGVPMDTGSGIYDEADGTGAQTIFTVPTFPTTDIDARKLIVTIDGIKQRPDVDYEYYLDEGVPTVRFLIEAPPTGSGNIQFHTLPGVVTSTYDAETIDGSSVVTNTLNGNRVIDATLDGDALIDGSTPVTKLEAPVGADNRAILFDTAGTAALQPITNDEITHTGASGRTDIGEAQTVVQFDGIVTFSVEGSSYTYVNTAATTQMVHGSWRVYNNGGSVGIFGPGWGGEIKVLTWEAEQFVWRDMICSVLVPPGHTIVWRGGGANEMRRIVTQEI